MSKTYKTPSVIESAPLHKGAHLAYIIVVWVVFVVLTVVFLLFPRSSFSELEKRDLATFPTTDSLFSDPEKYTHELSFWFSDTEPYRDLFMRMSMTIRNAFRFQFGDDSEVVSFKKAVENPEETPEAPEATDEVLEAQGNPLADANAKIANAGIVVVGSGPDVRALMAYGGGEKSSQPFLDLIGAYRKAIPDVQLYAAIIPTAAEYYLPTKAASASKSQKLTLDYLRTNLDSAVKYVDIHSQLAAHTRENIYLRTDHHWAPLGAFYAAKALAATAGVPFRDLSSYDEHVIHGYVGSMYAYSKDISVKNAPEDFYYYTPKDANEKTTYITYTVDKNYQITSERGPYEGQFFHKFPDGSSGAYCTFMGGDCHIVKVETGVANGRRIIIIKDSFGNPVPGYLFYSFEQIHVIDYRYFNKNLKKYVADNKITDLSFTFNIFTICSKKSMDKVNKFLQNH